MATSVTWADPGISAGDRVFVIDHDGRPVAEGVARMPGDGMVVSSEGMAVKVKERLAHRNGPRVRPSDWESVTDANAEAIKRRIAKAVRFIRQRIAEYDLPPVISFPSASPPTSRIPGREYFRVLADFEGGTL